MNINPTQLYLQIRTVLAVATLVTLAQLAGAAPTWNNPNGGNWSVAGNWNPSGAPGTASDVIFGDVGAGSPNTNDISSETVDSLTYNQDDGLKQTTVINPGQTLTISSSVAAGSAELYAGSTSAATTSGTLVPVAIQGLASTLTLTGAGDLWVAQGNSTAGAHIATLDMSGLGTLNANIGRLYVGVNINGINRPSGTLLLAQTNNITLTGASPQVEVQESGVNANGSVVSTLSFGQVNFLNADTIRFGGDKGNGAVNFAAAAYGSPSLVIRNNDGVSPCTVIDIGYNAYTSTGNSTVSTVDFSTGTVDISANLVHIPQGPLGTGTGTSTGTLTLGAGTLDVSDLEIGWGNATGASGATTGTLNVNDNGQFSTGAVVICSTVLDLARTNGGSATVSGTVNINGGEVIANAITSSGGASALNLNYGSLIVSNTAGSLAFPIRTFSIGTGAGTSLNVPVSTSGASMVVSNLTTGGSTSNNLVNITAVPPIASYPATFTIIQYQGVEAGSGSGTFALNSLPSASPSYVGTLVDAGAGSVQLKLTRGPVAVLGLTWTGASSDDWDTGTYNWLFQGYATNFFANANAVFNDSAAQTNISLDQALSPGSITVTNNHAEYTFEGSGYIAGAATLTKSGSSSLTLDNQGGNNNVSTVVINGGTLQVGENDTYGGLVTVQITNNGTLIFDRADNVTVSSPIAGTGALAQIGSGTLVLSGANSYGGATTVTNGGLEIDGTLGTGSVTTSPGTTLAGGGIVGGPVTVGGQFNPGPSGSTGTFTANDGLTLNAGSALTFLLSAANPNLSDSVSVTGNLHVNNNPITVQFDGTPQGGASYVLFTYTGTLSGSFNPTVLGTHFTTVLDTTSTPGSVLLDITSSSGYNLDWNSTSDPNWDIVTANWLNLNTLLTSAFDAGDNVVFDDTPGVVTSINIPAGVNVAPASITVTATNNYFTISGSGSITGSGGITLSGLGTFAIDTANSFTGPVDIQQGTLQTKNGAALGAASSVTVENGATLDVDGQNLGSAVITASGPGTTGSGAIINSGGTAVQAFRQVVLLADTTFGGSGNWEMNNSGGAASLSTGGQPFNLTKVGANTIDFQNLTTFDTALANIDIQQGTLLFDGITPDLGDPTYTLTIETGAQLAFAADQITYDKIIVINGDGSTQNINNEGGANIVLTGPVTLNGNCVINVGGTQLIMSNSVSGGGGIIKSGTSPLILTVPNTYTGATVVNAGSLVLRGATISTSTNITVAAGATLDTGGNGLTLVGGQSLSGNGTVTSGLVAGAGSMVSPAVTPGVSPVGVLTVSGAITLAGTNVMQLDPANGTNDVLGSSSSIAYGGTLSLTNLSNPTSGSSFQLFSASSYSGSFAAIIPPTPGPGLTWNTSALRTSGTISVGSSAPLNIGGIKTSGANVVVSGSGGTASSSYYVLATTNLTTPLAGWTRVATNQFDDSGNFSFTNAMTPSIPRRFFQIETP